MKKLFLLLFVLFSFLSTYAQERSVAGIPFMSTTEKAVPALISLFGQPSSQTKEEIVFGKVFYDGEKYDEAKFVFDGKGRLVQGRFRNIYQNHAKAVVRMNQIQKKYAIIYKTTQDENPDDGKFYVGYDKDGTRLFTITTFRNRMDFQFGPF